MFVTVQNVIARLGGAARVREILEIPDSAAVELDARLIASTQAGDSMLAGYVRRQYDLPENQSHDDAICRQVAADFAIYFVYQEVPEKLADRDERVYDRAMETAAKIADGTIALPFKAKMERNVYTPPVTTDMAGDNGPRIFGEKWAAKW